MDFSASSSSCSLRNIKKITGNITLFCKIVGFLRHFCLWIYLRLQGLNFSLQLFDSLFLFLRLGLSLLPCAELLIKLQEKRNKYGYVHITNVYTDDVNTHTHTWPGERQGVSREWPQGTSRDTRTRYLTFSGRYLFIALVALEPCCPLSLFQARLLCMLMDLTFAETKPCLYNNFTCPAGYTVGWWDRTLKKKTYPRPPWCHQAVVVMLFNRDLLCSFPALDFYSESSL